MIRFHANTTCFRDELEKLKAESYLIMWKDFFCLENNLKCEDFQITYRYNKDMPEMVKYPGKGTVGVVAIKIKVSDDP